MNRASDITAGALFKRPGKKKFHTAKKVVQLGFEESLPNFKKGKLMVIVSTAKKFIFSPDERFIVLEETLPFYSLSNN